jgi:putative tricarboxylic transport membrane protein
MFVTLVGGALVALGVLLAVQIARGERFEPQDAEGADSGQPTNRFAFWCALVGMGLPLVLMERVGFVLTATACFVAIAAAFGERRWLRMALIGFIVAAAAWGAFSYLGVTLGPFATFKLN